MRLHPTVRFMPGETPTSFASRLARRNDIASLHHLLNDLGLSIVKLVDGDHDTIASLAEISGAEAAPLLRETCRKVENRFLLRGQILTRASLVRPGFRICPACIMEDRRSTGETPETAAYCRTMWTVQHLRTCARHDLPLVDLPPPPRTAAHDFPPAIDEWIERGQAGMQDGCRRPVSQFENYLIGRLEGAQSDCWLDMLPFYAAAKVCEMTGVILTRGRAPVFKALTGDDWVDAGQQGFMVASAGPEQIERFIHDLWASYPSLRSTPAGPAAWFGRFYKWLEYETNDPAYNPVREIIVRFVAEHIPFHANERLFGQSAPYRKVHSLRTVELETKLSTKRIRKILVQANLIDPEHEHKTDHEVTFDAMAAAPLLDLCVNAMSTVDIAAALGISWGNARLIVKAGHLETIDKRKNATARPLVSSDDFDSFMLKLRDGAEPLAAVPDGACDLGSARLRAQCTLLEIVDLVIGRELAWVGWLTEASGFQSVIVNIDEIRSRLHRAELEGYTRREVKRVAGIAEETVEKLIAGGILQTKRQRHPATYYSVLLIPKDELDRFRARYVRLSDAAVILGLTMNDSRRALGNAGIGPALTKADFLTNFYLRSDIEKFAAIRRERTVTP